MTTPFIIVRTFRTVLSVTQTDSTALLKQNSVKSTCAFRCATETPQPHFSFGYKIALLNPLNPLPKTTGIFIFFVVSRSFSSLRPLYYLMEIIRIGFFRVGLIFLSIKFLLSSSIRIIAQNIYLSRGF